MDLLYNQEKVIDEELEKKNFKHAAENLSSLWNSIVIDKHPANSMYVDPPDLPEHVKKSNVNLRLEEQTWINNHVRSSQYFLQIVKCD